LLPAAGAVTPADFNLAAGLSRTRCSNPDLLGRAALGREPQRRQYGGTRKNTRQPCSPTKRTNVLVKAILSWWSCLAVTRKHLRPWPCLPLGGAASSPVAAGRIHAALKRLGPDVIQQLVIDYEAGHSATNLMQAYGLGKGTVLGILQEQGVKMRGQGIPDDRLGEVIELYKSGLSLMQISKRLDCSGETVRQALLAAEVRMRAKWERGPLRPP